MKLEGRTTNYRSRFTPALGRQLIAKALAWFRAEGLSYALIESMAHNEVGRSLYASAGFSEIGQLVHFAMKL